MSTLTRSAIGLPDSRANRRPVTRIGGVTVHHSDGLTLAAQRGQDADDAARWWRNIWSFHTARPLPSHDGYPRVEPWSGARGWDDIGYHLGVHLPSRTVLSGRPLDRIGAHAPGANRTRIGLCVLGGNPDVDAADIGWLADLIDRVRGQVGYPAVWTVDGHRDHRQTTCPGANLYRALPALAAPQPAPEPDPTDPDGETVERILARLDGIDRTGRATLAAVIAAHRATHGLDPSSVDDQRWTDRIWDDRATIGEALTRITDKTAKP